jgi:hypothetical protein
MHKYEYNKYKKRISFSKANGISPLISPESIEIALNSPSYALIGQQKELQKEQQKIIKQNSNNNNIQQQQFQQRNSIQLPTNANYVPIIYVQQSPYNSMTVPNNRRQTFDYAYNNNRKINKKIIIKKEIKVKLVKIGEIKIGIQRHQEIIVNIILMVIEIVINPIHNNQKHH